MRRQSATAHWRRFAMLLVSKTVGPSCTVLSIDGRLSADSIGVVEGFCARALSTGSQVRLIMHDVTTVDQAGDAMLGRLVARGVHLRSIYTPTSYLVNSSGRTDTEPLNSS